MSKGSGQNRSQFVTGQSGDEVRPLVQALLRAQAYARSHGLFAHDRGLLDCRRCGLSEDVDASGCLMTYWWYDDSFSDTGMRFVERDEKQWQCPHCQHTMSAPEPGEELEWIRNERFGVLRQFGFDVGTQLTPIEDVQANALYLAKSGAHDPHTPSRQAIVCFDSHLETETLEWLRQQKGQRVIVLEAALDTTAKWNLHHQLGDGLVVF